MQVVAKVDWPKDAPRFRAGDVLDVAEARGETGAPLWVFKFRGTTVMVRARGAFPRRMFERARR